MNHTSKFQTFRPLLAAAFAFSTAMTLVPTRAALADDKMEADQLVDKSQLTLQNFQCDDTMGAYRALLPKAHAVLVVPNLLKGAFVVGASGGSGVLTVRGEKEASWSDPAFYTLGGGSFGAQIGGQASELILLAMTDRGAKAFLSDSFKLGGEAGIAAGPVGLGASAATMNLSADILSFSRAKGAYGGISVEGSVLAVRNDLNRAYYGRQVSTIDILVNRTVMDPHGAKLARFIESSVGGKLSTNWCDTAPTGRMDIGGSPVAGFYR